MKVKARGRLGKQEKDSLRAERIQKALFQLDQEIQRRERGEYGFSLPK